MDIKRFAGVVLDAFSVTFKFICDVDSFNDLAKKGVIYKKENKDTASQLKNTGRRHSFLIATTLFKGKITKLLKTITRSNSEGFVIFCYRRLN